MPFSIVSAQGRQTLKLEGAVTIRDVQALASGLVQDLEESEPLDVDTEGLEDIDTCVLQLVCSLRKTVPALSFGTPSAIFLSAVERSGLWREMLSAKGDL